MRRVSITDLPLHYGRAPRWLFKRMVKLANCIVTIIIDEFGVKEFLTRISDPFWFQGLGCVLGYDWHSSGLTTVLTGALKEAINPEEHGIAVCGGKGRASRKTPREIVEFGELLGLSTGKIESLTYTSRIAAKVDNSAIQSGHPLYHHVTFISEDGEWAIVQQGMNVQDRTARRYHWLSEKCSSYIVEPHSAIVGDSRRNVVLDMTSRESEGCRKAIVDLAKEEPRRIYRMLKSIRPKYQSSLDRWIGDSPKDKEAIEYLKLPSRVNWRVLRRTYEAQIKSFEEFLSIEGVGPATVRGLAIVSDLMFGERPSWRDPIKYTFAFGGKDGVPFPVNRRAMDESVAFLREVIECSKMGSKERLSMLKRLSRLTSGFRVK